ncbi:MAG: hypothetical protein E7578_04990 [Ruminococcaceae bacterium]|nr:hypothetical protein [Oscillospiraceae bacterium]
MDKIKFCIVGGDMRQLYLAEFLIDLGYTVSICGIDKSRISGLSLKNARLAVQPAETAIPQSKVLVLPIPISRDGFHISTPLAGSRVNYEINDILDMTDKDTVIVGGYVSDYMRSHIEERHMRIFDYNDSDAFQIRNSISTAEGALEIAMRELPVTIRGTNAAVMGYGRCGRTLASLLRAVGASVTVSARSESALAWAETEGCRSCNLSKFHTVANEFPIIFNTVPHPIIGHEILSKVKPEALIIDIASLPGGIDTTSEIPDSLTVIYAGGLPGRTSPKSAGEIVGQSILERLTTEGVIT